MPSRNVKLVTDYYYHIYNRVIESKKLFYTTDDYLFYLKLWNEIDFSKACKVISYCLMPGHYHYLVKITDADVFPKKVSYLFNKYLKSLNAVRREKGHYFKNRYKAKLIDNQRYLIQLCCYIHFNPKKAGLVKSLNYWPYSNYLEFVGKRNGNLFDQEFYQDNIQSTAEYEEIIKNQYNEEEIGNYIFDE